MIKEANPDWWVIKINLPDHLEALAHNFLSDLLTAIDFFANLPEVVGQNHSFFVRSLLKHRLKTGDRIVLMLDGFDEIDSRGRKSVIQLIKAITENESVRIYVATRPHTVDELQLELSQLAFFLAPFNEEDQIKCLVNFWENKIPNLQDEENKKLKDYAKTLARKVNMTEDDRDLIGIPLQCRVVAECFLQQAKREVKQSTEEEEEDQMHFDLAGLYERLMQTNCGYFWKRN